VSPLHRQMHRAGGRNGDHVQNPEYPLTGHSIDVTLEEFKNWSERVVWQVFKLSGLPGTGYASRSMVVSLDFSPNGTRVVCGSDRLVKIWDTETRVEVRSFVGVR